MPEVIRICVGTEPKMLIPEKVLMYTIRKHTSRPVAFFRMLGPFWDKAPSGVTGFSFRRWMIPEFFDHKGFAIYLDADQIVLDDIAKLWSSKDSYEGKSHLWCAYKGKRALTSVLLINCAMCRTWQNIPVRLKNKELSRREVMHGKWIRPKPFDLGYGWNHIDLYKPGETKLLHYSDLKRQPWFQPEHPLRDLWEKELKEAIEGGVVSQEDLRWARGIYRKKEGLHPYYDHLLKG